MAALYQCIRGHAVVLPQNSSLLLDILPSETLVLHDIIRVIWVGKTIPTAAKIRLFAQV